MHRFYLPPEECQGRFLRLQGREARHALRVLRLRAGERLVVLDGAGKQCLCEVQRCEREELELAVLEENRSEARSSQVTLLQAIPKGKLLENIIQKATELGVHRIIPLESKRTVVQLGDEDGSHKLEKWRQVAVEAIKQCGCPWLPQVDAPIQLADVLSRCPRVELALVGSLRPESQHPRRYFQAFRVAQARPPKSVCVWVGPEGDFTPEELAQIQKTGAKPISLGRLVLRAETAALYSLSIINYELESPDPAVA